MGENTGDAAVTENGKKSGEGGAVGNENSVVVLKVDLHCRGCVSKILKCVRGYEGVVEAKVEKEANKLTVEGKVDAAKLREMLQVKTKKKVEIVPIPPPPPPPPQQQKKKKEEEKENKGGVVGDGRSVENGKIDEKKSAEKKPKELPVTTVLIKLGGLDCQGCVAKINKIIAKTAGVQNFTIDKDKDVATVKGAVDSKALADNLREKMRRSVEVVPQIKEKDKEDKDKKEVEEDKDKEKEKGGGGGGDASGGGKKKGGGGGGKAEDNNGEGKLEGSRMEYYGLPQSQPGYENRSLGENSYGFMYGEQVHAPQLFSDENPNACCVM